METRPREREVEEVVDAPLPGAKTSTEPDRPSTVSGHLLSLQRNYGNAAVTGVVQRKERPASTDAPGAKGKKATKKKEPEQTNYAPTEHHPRYGDWTDEALSTRASEAFDQNAKSSWYFAAELYEEYWFRHKEYKPAAMSLWRVYKKIGDKPREDFWVKVQNGEIKPGKPKTEDMSDKAF
ncbi:MAG: hypothetical protein QOF60_2351 [Actinomycetota bacterium]|jgi:hypothetical protein|nr:hypothetical protein [Actinomycetota bacterium]